MDWRAHAISWEAHANRLQAEVDRLRAEVQTAWDQGFDAGADRPIEEEEEGFPCGHLEVTKGCGGCDPGAIEFVIEDADLRRLRQS